MVSSVYWYLDIWWTVEDVLEDKTLMPCLQPYQSLHGVDFFSSLLEKSGSVKLLLIGTYDYHNKYPICSILVVGYFVTAHTCDCIRHVKM